MITSKVDSKEMQNFIHQLVIRTGDLKPFFVAAKTVMDRSTMKNFREQGRPKKWVALSPFTQAVRGKEGTLRGAPILQRFGTLRQSIGTEILEVTKTEMRYGTKQIKAPLLQFGGTIKPKKGKFLAIPLPGVVGRPRDYEDTFFKKGKKPGTAMIFQKIEGGIRPLFLLKKRIKIPPRPFLLWQQEDVDALTEICWSFLSDIGKYKELAGSLGGA